MKKIFAPIAAVALVSLPLFAAESSSTRKAPELVFNLPGKPLQLLSQYKGKVIALEFIFTTCPHCQAASKVMTKFQQEFASRGLQALDLAVNANADLLVENFVKDYEVGFPVGWIQQQDMVKFMGFSSERFVVPQLALIDRQGVIRFQTPALEDASWDELMKEDVLRANIEKLLGPSRNAARTAGNGRVVLAKRQAQQ